MKKYKIIIFDGSFKTTTFINRLVEGLSANNDLYILGFNEEISVKVESVNYIGLGSNDSKLLFVKRAVQLRGYNFLKQIQLIRNLLKGNKKQIQQENLQLAIHAIQPDILHFQWVSVLSYYDQLILPSHTKTILSQRGFHINVRPFIDQENQNFLKNIFSKIDGFHSVSNAIRQNSNEIYKSYNKIDEVVYSGFDYKKIPVKTNSEFSEVIQIISIGRNHWIKDYKTAIKAMALLKNNNIKFHYTIIGVKEDEELLYLVSDLNLKENISFISSVSQEKVFDKMIISDLFLLPSIEEGIANVCIEAMFCKLPVLSTNCGGMKELVEEGITGFIVPTRSPELMASKIEDIKGMYSNQIDAITQKAREKVVQQHNTQKMVTDMEALYKKVYEND
jgi:colanic acid/amylovoran biosynthesis glycosyltransferase